MSAFVLIVSFLVKVKQVFKVLGHLKHREHFAPLGGHLGIFYNFFLIEDVKIDTYEKFQNVALKINILSFLSHTLLFSCILIITNCAKTVIVAP